MKKGDIPYVSRSAFNNGVVDYGSDTTQIGEDINRGNAITIGAEGITAFYQPNVFLTGNRITILRNKYLNELVALFICTILNLSMENRYSYGYTANQDRLSDLIIKLPATDKNQPDWEFMENYIRQLPYTSSLGGDSRDN